MGLRRPRCSDSGPYPMLARENATSIADVTVAAARVEKPYCETRKGTPQSPANVSTIPEKAPGMRKSSQVLRYEKTSRSCVATEGALVACAWVWKLAYP